eukprot:3056066-Prymnesium_polylepis.1
MASSPPRPQRSRRNCLPSSGGRCSSHDHPSMQCRTTAKRPRAGSRTRGQRFSTQPLANVTTSPGGAHMLRLQYIYPCIAV